MASMIATSKHIRSISLPSRNHPLTSTLEEQICRLKSSSSSPCNKLSDLKELHGCVDEFLQLPQTQHALSHERHGEAVEVVLDGSLRLLDVCGTTRDVFSHMKECVQQLESSFRRRNGGESGLAREVGSYMSSKKEINKVISKCLKNLNTTKKSCTSAESDSGMVGLLREVEEMSLQVFESLLSFVGQTKTKSKWCVVLTLLKSKQVSCEGEVGKIDAELLAMKSSKEINIVILQNAMKSLKELEMMVQEAEEELECVFRQMVKARVSLLNILNH